MISFKTKLFKIGKWTILHLPPVESAKLPTRSILMVAGTLNDIPFKALLEPDGVYGSGKKPSHWFRPDDRLLKEARAKVGNIVNVEIEPIKEWVEPEVPADVIKALDTSKKAKDIWDDITPSARWDWIRWVRSVKTEDTRKKRLDVMLDRLNKGIRRPCCFNRNKCSVPEVSHNWSLLLPTS